MLPALLAREVALYPCVHIRFLKTTTMSALYKFLGGVLGLLAALSGSAQTAVQGKLIDAITREPLQGASLHCTDKDCPCACLSGVDGSFILHCTDCRQLSVSYIGYQPRTLSLAEAQGLVTLAPSSSPLQEVVVTASRGEAVRRAQAPVAISTLSAKTLAETRAVSADQLLNKVSGVNMVNLGNEQHQMSIRQPMTTKSLFLYLEDGIPVRTTGLFNHNALLEMNLAATKSIEVIKGPSSSLYGSEAIGGVVNFISLKPTATPLARLSLQGSNMGFTRADAQLSMTRGRWGFVLSGYYADKRNGFMDYTDYHKGTATARIEYRINDKTLLTNSTTVVNYYSDMPSGVDSTMFATHTFSNPQTFTYREVKALRNHTTLNRNWTDRSHSSLTLIYRDNTIGQNPNYRIKDDYRKSGNSWIGKKDLAHGEVNESSFHSAAFVAQHRQEFSWKKASVTAGLSVDLSPSSYHAQYIRIKKDSVSKRYVSYQNTDSTLTDYRTRINNYAGFINFEFSPLNRLRLVASLRYDAFRYGFDNHLKPSAFSGSPDTLNQFRRISPKIGLTYSLSKRAGVYANYSQGFVPPQVTEMYTGVKVPDLRPSVFNNYEAGGWAEILHNRLSADLSIYRLEGSQEVISVRLDDGSSENRNAGKTLHRGIEFGLNATPVKEVSVRLSGAYSKHSFESFVEKGNNYSGNEMNNAPHWMHNAEVWYRPRFVKGLRLGAEWQKIGSYFMDPKNTARYEGYDVLNLRAGYAFRGFEIWLHVLNATDNYYSYISTKSTSYSYQLAEPRSFTLGFSYDLGSLFHKKP